MLEELNKSTITFPHKSMCQTLCVSYMMGMFLVYLRDYQSSILYKSGYSRRNRQPITADLMPHVNQQHYPWQRVARRELSRY